MCCLNNFLSLGTLIYYNITQYLYYKNVFIFICLIYIIILTRLKKNSSKKHRKSYCFSFEVITINIFVIILILCTSVPLHCITMCIYIYHNVIIMLSVHFRSRIENRCNKCRPTDHLSPPIKLISRKS